MKPMKQSRDIVPDIIITDEELQNTNKLNFKKCDKIQLIVILLLCIKGHINIFYINLLFNSMCINNQMVSLYMRCSIVKFCPKSRKCTINTSFYCFLLV